MQAQRACGRLAVNSYERESASVCLSISGDELSSHETDISIERVGSTVTGVEVCSRSRKGKIDFAKDTAEVGDERGVVSRDGVYAFNCAREEKMDGCAKRSGDCVWNGFRLHRAFPVRFCGCKQRLRQIGLKYKPCTCSTCRSPNKPSSRATHGVLLGLFRSLATHARSRYSEKSLNRRTNCASHTLLPQQGLVKMKKFAYLLALRSCRGDTAFLLSALAD
jgi:hypothetical protein